jgi:molecular chaperone GrpE
MSEEKNNTLKNENEIKNEQLNNEMKNGSESTKETIQEEKISSSVNEVESLKKELLEANEKLNKINQQILYMKSDMDNIRKTFLKDSEREIQRSSIRIIKEFLSVLDNFELCIDSEKKAGKTLPEGFDLIYKSFIKTLETLEIKETKNDSDFDPSIHEAINFINIAEANGKKAQNISSVLKKGYLYKGILIRPAQVVVVKE